MRVVATLSGLGMVAALAAYPVFQYTSVENVTVEVRNTDRECKGQDCRYVVYTDREVLENRDAWLFLKFNSSDVYSKLTPGRKYEMRVNGLRVPFLSWYRNIIDVKETST